MRKLYWYRYSFSPVLLVIPFIAFVLLTAIFHFNQQNIISLIYQTSSHCDRSTVFSVEQPLSIPPHYLLIPYREFATRTSISCEKYKLDEPPIDRTKLHPRHSPYLKGSFPYVVPHANITFDDVEAFYTQFLSTNQTQVSFASNITFTDIPYRYENGMWHPTIVTSAQRTAFLVPLQGRDYNAKVFLLNMHAYARRQLLTYIILLIEQVSPLGHRFNKGRLFNAGLRYIEDQSLDIDCLILHDVDLIPENDGNFYSCESSHPKHTTIRVRQIAKPRSYTRYYEFLIGGVLLLTPTMYKSVNGFSNLYWGWGGEDDDLSLRFIERRLCVVRPSYDLAIYAALPHPRGQRNNARYNLLTWSTVRLDRDGYKQIKPMINYVEIRKTSTVTHLKLNVNADESLYKPPSVEKIPPLSKKVNLNITSTSRTTKATVKTTVKKTAKPTRKSQTVRKHT